MRGKNWNKVKIHREFRKRVNKSDYAEEDVEGLLENLYVLAKDTAYLNTQTASNKRRS